jgi:hypothetical protein
VNKCLHIIALVIAIAWITTHSLAQVPSPSTGVDLAALTKANSGNTEAEFRVGMQYELGVHVSNDTVRAAAWNCKTRRTGGRF